MANLISAGTYDFSAASWGVADTTMLKLDGTTSTNVTTSNLDSSAYTPGAITVDGILLNMSLRAASVSGTMTVTLRNSTAGINVTSVTINNSDLPVMHTSATSPGCWIFFKFSASQLLLAATNYVVRVTSSVTTQCSLYAGSSNNWNLALRTTTTAAPGANDRLFIQGEKTGAGATTANVITMDNNSTTDFGKIDITDSGSLTYSIAGNTQLRTSGNLDVWAGGTLNIGTVANPVPSGTTAILEFDCGSDVQYGLQIQSAGTLVAQGHDKDIKWCKLGADAAATATALTSATNLGTNWKNGDSILITSTTRTAAESEVKALGADSSGTSIPTIAALTYAHGGNSTTMVQGEIGNLTSNVKLRAVSTFSWYIYSFGATVDMDWVEIIDVGSSTTNKRGVQVGASTVGSFNMQYSTIRDCDTTSAQGFHLASGAGNVTFNNNIIYNTLSNGLVTSGTLTAVEMDGNLICTTSSSSLNVSGYNGLTFDNNIIVSCSSDAITTSPSANAFVSFDNNEFHSNNGTGCLLAFMGGTYSNIKTWRNSSYGLSTGVNNGAAGDNTTYDTFTVFGNGTAGIISNSEAGVGRIFKNFTVNAGVTLTQPIGYLISSAAMPFLTMINCSFGATQAHATSDFDISTGTTVCATLYGCTLASTTEVSNQSLLKSVSFIRSSRHDGVAGAYKAWFKYGTIVNDTVVFNTASPSEKLTPNNASITLESSSKYVALNSGQTATVSVYVRKTAAGNQPRLIVKANYSSGITTDTVLDTMTAGTASWEQLSGTTAAVTEDCVLSFIVDADSTAGTVNIDDWTASVA